MHPTLASALEKTASSFGAIDRQDLQREFPGAGDMLASAMVSHGWARERHDRLTLTPAGWKAVDAVEGE